MDIFLIIIAIVGVLGVIAAAIGIWKTKNQKDKKFWTFIAVGVGSLIAIILAIFGLGRKREIKVEFIETHKREIAPTGKEVGRLDEESDNLNAEIDKTREEGEKLDMGAKDLDEQKAKLDAKSEKTDKNLEKAGSSWVGNDNDSDDKPDSDLSDRIRQG